MEHDKIICNAGLRIEKCVEFFKYCFLPISSVRRLKTEGRFLFYEITLLREPWKSEKLKS